MRLHPGAAAVVAASCLFAQSAFDHAPPGVEEALRARVSKFYQAHVDGKFRLADVVVAEDSKDAFFAADKKRFYSFQISSVTFEEDYTKARVLVLVETDMVMLTQRVRVKAPITSLWKLENGEWWWYLLKQKEGVIRTPFGSVAASHAEVHGAPPAPPAVSMPDGSDVKRMVRTDKATVQFKAGEPGTDTVTVTNGMPGPIGLSLSYDPVPGLSVELDRAQIAAKESARVSIAYKPENHPAKAPVTIRVVVQPGGLVLPVHVAFAAPKAP